LVRVATRSCAVVGGGGRIGFGEGVREGGRLGELERVRVFEVARRGVGDRDRSGIPPPGLVGDSGSEVVERVRKPAGVGGVTIGKGRELGGGGVRASSAGGVGGGGGACACTAAAATVEAALKYKSDLTNPGMSSSSSNARTPCCIANSACRSVLSSVGVVT
jgi:hypothetical protein